jgi:hypothetical protein
MLALAEGLELAPGSLSSGYSLRAQSLKLLRGWLAVADCVLQALVTHEGSACLQIGSTHKIKPAGMSEHVRMNSQGREVGWQFEPVEHPPEGRWLHPE